MKILNSVKKLFWDVKKNSLDVDKNQREIITRTINYGSLRDWHWLRKQYGEKSVSDFIHQTQRSAIRPEVKRLAEIIFS